MRALFIITLTFLILSSCTDAPDFDTVPSMTFEGIIGDTLAQSTSLDTVFLQFTIRDADGDIGDDGTNRGTIFMTDLADGFELPPFILPELSEQGSGKGIEADVTLLFISRRGDYCCRYPDGSTGCVPSQEYPLDSLFYEAYAMDHAGNQSEPVQVGPIYLICD